MKTFHSRFLCLTLLLATALGTTAAAQTSVLVISSGDPSPTAPFSPEFSATHFESLGTVSSATPGSIFINDLSAADSWQAGSSVLDYLNSFDLVVFGRGLGGGATYDAAGWAAVEAGILSVSAFTVRTDRLGWADVGSVDNVTAGLTVSIVDGSHEITNGTASPIEYYTTGNGATPLQPLAAGDIGGTGAVLATLANGEIQTAVWDIGDTVASGNIVAGRRAFFAMNQNAWSDVTLTEDGALAFQNTLEWTAQIPEPSTYAAIFGALVLGVVILRRRKN